jgi:hypothetical protein
MKFSVRFVTQGWVAHGGGSDPGTSQLPHALIHVRGLPLMAHSVFVQLLRFPLKQHPNVLQRPARPLRELVPLLRLGRGGDTPSALPAGLRHNGER